MAGQIEEHGQSQLQAMHVAEELAGEPRPIGQVRFCFAGKGYWAVLDALRAGPRRRGVMPVAPALVARVKFYGRQKGGAIPDGVILSLTARAARSADRGWSCDSEKVIAAFDGR